MENILARVWHSCLFAEQISKFVHITKFRVIKGWSELRKVLLNKTHTA